MDHNYFITPTNSCLICLLLNPISSIDTNHHEQLSGAVSGINTSKGNGISVTLFESARGPGGRMSQRREIISEDREGAIVRSLECYHFLVRSNSDVLRLVLMNGNLKVLLKNGKRILASFDCISQGKFLGH
ncbi:hypothetical protein NC652_004394 [Populus alba x Populus x berolinensis]|nr:hypothetical protein NC652_004394 [Populus alba x Populus x berolinensis]